MTQNPKIMLTCRTCQEEFVLTPNKPGFRNECPNCTKGDVPLLGGNMVYLHKTAPYIEIKSMAEAKQFAKATKRFGHGVTVCITQSRESLVSRDWTGRTIG